MYKATKTFNNFSELAEHLNKSGADLRAYNVRQNQKVDALVFDDSKMVEPAKESFVEAVKKKVTKKKVSKKRGKK